MDLYDALSMQTKEELVESLFDHALNNDMQIIDRRDYVTRAQIPLLHVDLVEALINNGLLDVNSRYYDMHQRLVPYQRGCTLLCYAIMWGNIPLTEMLVRKHANVNLGQIREFGEFRYTPLSCAVDVEDYNHQWAHRIHMIQVLHSAGNLNFDVYVPFSRHIFRHFLTYYDMNMLDELLALGADINTQFSDTGTTVGEINLFTYAVLRGDYDLARELKRRGANTDHVFMYYNFHKGELKRFTALQHFVADPNKTENQLNQLLDIGVGLNVTDHEGCTALWNLARENKIQMCVRLIEQGADVSIRCQERHGNSTALEVAFPDCRAAMEQALHTRRMLHVRALHARSPALPKEMIQKIILENGL